MAGNPDSFTITAEPDPQDVSRLWDELTAYNCLYAGPDNHQHLAIFLRDEQGNLCGGLLADTYWEWLVIHALWLREELRRQGIGQRLIAAAEAEAIRRGCRHAHLDTMDFQAPEFYKKLGYQVWGVLDDLPQGHSRIFLRKDLFASQVPQPA